MCGGMPAPFGDPVGELFADVAEDLAEAVLGRDRSRLSVSVAGGLACGAPRALAGGLRFTQLTLERRHPLLDGLGGFRRPMRSSRPRTRAQVLVCLLDLREPPRGLFRTAVAVGMVQLDQSPVRVMLFLGRRSRRHPEDAVRIATHLLNLTECRGRPPGVPDRQRDAGAADDTADRRPRRAGMSCFPTEWGTSPPR